MTLLQVHWAYCSPSFYKGTVILLHCHRITLSYYWVLYCYIIALLHYYIVTLLHCCYIIHCRLEKDFDKTRIKRKWYNAQARIHALSGNFPVLEIYKNSMLSKQCRSIVSTLGRLGEGPRMNTVIDKYPHHHGDTYKVMGILTKTRVGTSSGTFPRESASKSCCPDR